MSHGTFEIFQDACKQLEAQKKTAALSDILKLGKKITHNKKTSYSAEFLKKREKDNDKLTSVLKKANSRLTTLQKQKKTSASEIDTQQETIETQKATIRRLQAQISANSNITQLLPNLEPDEPTTPLTVASIPITHDELHSVQTEFKQRIVDTLAAVYPKLHPQLPATSLSEEDYNLLAMKAMERFQSSSTLPSDIILLDEKEIQTLELTLYQQSSDILTEKYMVESDLKERITAGTMRPEDKAEIHNDSLRNLLKTVNNNLMTELDTIGNTKLEAANIHDPTNDSLNTIKNAPLGDLEQLAQSGQAIDIPQQTRPNKTMESRIDGMFEDSDNSENVNQAHSSISTFVPPQSKETLHTMFFEDTDCLKALYDGIGEKTCKELKTKNPTEYMEKLEEISDTKKKEIVQDQMILALLSIVKHVVTDQLEGSYVIDTDNRNLQKKLKTELEEICTAYNNFKNPPTGDPQLTPAQHLAPIIEKILLGLNQASLTTPAMGKSNQIMMVTNYRSTRYDNK